jgi:hypothetical protein
MRADVIGRITPIWTLNLKKRVETLNAFANVLGRFNKTQLLLLARI